MKRKYELPWVVVKAYKPWENLSELEKERLFKGDGEKTFIGKKLYWHLSSMDPGGGKL